MSEEQLKVFEKAEGRLKPVTIKNMKRFFKTFAEVANDNNLDIRENAKQTYEKLKTTKNSKGELYKESSIRSIMKAVVNYFQLNEEAKTEHFKFYKKALEQLETKIDSKPKELTERQKKVDYQEGIKKFLQFVEDKDLDLSEEGRAYLLYSFYILMPPRRLDYVDMVYKKSFRGLKNPDDETNYLVEYRRTYTFVFNKFKTDKSFKQQRIKIKNPILIKILENEDFSNNTRIYGSSERTFQRRFAEISMRFFGEDLSVQDMRVLHSSDAFKDFKEFIDTLKKDADMMGHQVSTKINTYIRQLD